MAEFKVTSVNLDKERRMKLTLRGINAFEQVTGVDILGLTDLQDLSPKELGALLWACLMWEDRELKLESIPEIIEKADAAGLMSSLLECITNSLPEVKPGTAPLAVPPASPPGAESESQPTGSISGPLASIASNSPKFLS